MDTTQWLELKENEKLPCQSCGELSTYLFEGETCTNCTPEVHHV